MASRRTRQGAVSALAVVAVLGLWQVAGGSGWVDTLFLPPPSELLGTLAGLWRSGWPMLSAFAVSFMVIGVFWNAHRRIFSQITRFSGGVFLFNLLLLGCVALMPFATSLIYSHGPHDQTLMIYLSLVAVTGLMQGLVYGYAAFISDSLQASVTRPQRIVTFLTMIILPVVVCSMALALTGGGSIVGFGVTIAMVAVLVAARRLLDRKLKGA